MAIYRLIREASFDSADCQILGAAYEAALQSLALKDREDPVTLLVAQKIIDVFAGGERDSAKISAAAVEALGVPKP
jgi:hypothetical protein